MTVLPYKDKAEGKKQQVAQMFDNISGKYDFLNTFLSLGIDKLWRRSALKHLPKNQVNHLLDVATGTGEFAIEALLINPRKITGIDISEGMLAVGIEKIKQRKLDSVITLQKADSESIPFPDSTFDACTVAFGVRNFEDLEKGITEIARVLQQSSKLVVLEFSKPKAFPVKQLYNFYFRSILPRVGKSISKDSSAYTYLPQSVNAFPDGEVFVQILLKCGFQEAKAYPLTFGIATVYVATK